MRAMNLMVGLLQVAGMIGLGIAGLAADKPLLIGLFGLAAVVTGALGGRNLACALFGSPRDQWEA